LATSALSLSHIDAYYGDSHVLADVSFELGEALKAHLKSDHGKIVDAIYWKFRA